jgi:uncharacterized SAM-binding protein YcdF (DUF218 family)
VETVLVKAVAALVLPPGGNIVLGIIGLALWRRARAVSAVLLAIAIVTLCLLSVPRVADLLYASVESFEPRLPGAVVAEDVGAIVVLAGGRMANAPEYGGETVGRYSLERLRYGARLSRETGLPLLLSGGSVHDEPASEASLMRDVLVDELGVPVRWLEETSRNTAENARYSAEILAAESIAAIILVTHAAHMPRAVQVFENHGVRVYAAPTAYRIGNPAGGGLLDWLPSANALERSRAALHELLGSVWYRIRY